MLDARDPLGTRCRSVEKYLKTEAQHKHLIFVLNKCDLVPTSVAVSYLVLLVISLPIFPMLLVRTLSTFSSWKTSVKSLGEENSELAVPMSLDWELTESRFGALSLARVCFILS